MAPLHLTIPQPAAGDSDQVQNALRSAREHANGARPAEAVRWIRLAAAAAEAAGNDARALVLARAAADLAGDGDVEVVGATNDEGLQDIDSDFSDQTIVDKAPAAPPTPVTPRGQATESEALSADDGPLLTPQPRSAGPAVSVHEAVRVAVRNVNGRLDVKVLADGERATGEAHEALLVPISPRAEFWR
jgi:hypothetical protein